ncbi:hypothetical protein [Methanoregula sp. UBA64]|uniref:hypothetical protein n=1 Tax=Methanoregula sp. UBA64 TaxID=1915554 RepID=UPI0025E5C64A|nr:hypothetical protein [Methanoregula sp. UBA64]
MTTTPTHDTKTTNNSIPKTSPATPGSATGAHSSAAPKVSSPAGKGVKSLVHESHKTGYKKDRPMAVAGAKAPQEPARK